MGHASLLEEREVGSALEPTRPPRDALTGFWHRVFGEPLQRVEQETRTFLDSKAGHRADWKVVIVLVTVAVCLTLQKYLSLTTMLSQALKLLAVVAPVEVLSQAQAALEQSETTPIGQLFHWGLRCLLIYSVIPALVIRLLLKERIGDYGVKLTGAWTGLWIYAVMLASVLPLVVWVSQDLHFQETYPFYPLSAGDSLWPNFWRWELLYVLQFFGLEFFFRGFMLHGIRHRFGIYSVFVMTVPYCMIHFGKPAQETFAAIAAGIVLGFMSLKTRSIWMGAVLHVSVALSMDFASLWRKGFFS